MCPNCTVAEFGCLQRYFHLEYVPNSAGSRSEGTGSHVHCACGNVSKNVQNRNFVTTDHQQEVICYCI